MVDGGVLALSGFFYQLLGSVAGLAQAANDPLAVLEAEHSGQDALLSLTSSKRLQQFKYSGVDAPITPVDLAEILSKLEKHDADCKYTWELCTNRPYSSGVKALLCIGDPNPNASANVSSQNRSVITRLGPRLKRTSLTFSDLNDQLSKRGRLFGLTDDEIEKGADHLVGAMISLITKHKRGVPVGRLFLDEKLVGIKNPLPLHGPERVPNLIAELDALASSGMNGPKLDDAVPREALKDLFRKQDDSVVVVTGPGGCGKTLSVLRAIRDHIEANEVLGGMLVSEVKETLETLVARWRSSSDFQNPELLHKAIERLRIANADHGSLVLILGLDGLDEHEWQSSNRLIHVRELVRFVRDACPSGPADVPPLKLIITCRKMAEIADLLSRSGVGGGSRLDYPEFPLSVFVDSELHEVWRKWFPKLVLPPLTESTESRDFESLSEAAQTTTANDEKVIQALRHPTMLGCFRDLDENQQLSLLEHDFEAWQALMERYVKWFTLKVSKRRDLPCETVRRMVSACAHATMRRNGDLHDRMSEWVTPAADYSPQKVDAIHLFEDAVSSEIVVTIDGDDSVPARRLVKWRWRYPFVEEYLNKLA